MSYWKVIFMFSLLATVLGAAPAGLLATPPSDLGGQDYVVQADDWLSKLADKFYGDPLAYVVIVEATNLRATQDISYRSIDNPNIIEIGQKLFIPAVHEISAEMAAAALEEKTVLNDAPVTQAEPTAAQLQLLASLSPKGVPPELQNEVWLNSEPLHLADLQGKVVIINFWTFGCINCKNVLPSLRTWHKEYADEGLVIIGVHTPEFDYESDIDNVRDALVRLDVQYPVAIDNDWQAWRSYKKPFGQRYWPTKYFVDKTGNVRHIHIGEGGYAEQEEIIQALLAEKL
jgi:thiol-disulfide isomerase/thioredoxin